MHVTLVEWVCSCTMCTWSIQIFDDELFIFLPGPFFLPLRDFCFLYMQWGKSHFLFYFCNNWLNKIDEKVLRKSVISRLLYSTYVYILYMIGPGFSLHRIFIGWQKNDMWRHDSQARKGDDWRWELARQLWATTRAFPGADSFWSIRPHSLLILTTEYCPLICSY